MVVKHGKRRTGKETILTDYPSEERSAEAMTILWMLSAVATLAAEAVSVGSRALLWWLPAAAAAVGPIVPAWFAFCALVTGTVCLALTPLVWMLRRTKPPPSVLWTAVGISLLPWIIQWAIWLIGNGH